LTKRKSKTSPDTNSDSIPDPNTNDTSKKTGAKKTRQSKKQAGSSDQKTNLSMKSNNNSNEGDQNHSFQTARKSGRKKTGITHGKSSGRYTYSFDRLHQSQQRHSLTAFCSPHFSMMN
jgi:hypothetical protein